MRDFVGGHIWRLSLLIAQFGNEWPVGSVPSSPETPGLVFSTTALS